MSSSSPLFSILEMPRIPPEVSESFGNLAFDEYAGNSRHRRFSQYRVRRNEPTWEFELLEPRSYIQYSQYNKVAGGIRREYPPLKVDLLPWVRHAAENLPLTVHEDWQVNVHQIRVYADPGEPGSVVPEGVHQDGHEYVFVGVFARADVIGGEFHLHTIDNKHGPAFLRATIPAGMGLVMKDLQLWHNATDVTATSAKGYRDTVIAAFSRWSDRWHGDEFEQRALGGRDDN